MKARPVAAEKHDGRPGGPDVEGPHVSDRRRPSAKRCARGIATPMGPKDPQSVQRCDQRGLTLLDEPSA
jgi:hypothetical protein